jgi:hypothetical protein
MRGQIKNCRENRDRVEREHHNERDYNMYDPYYDQHPRHHSPARNKDSGRIKPFLRNLWKVIWPLNFKPTMIDKYGGTTNPAE